MKKKSRKDKNNFTGHKLKLIKKASEPLYSVPESTNEWIEIKRISESGIFDLGENIYSSTYSFSDINWEGKPYNEQLILYDKFVELLDSIDGKFKITIYNHKVNMRKFENDVMMKEQMDEKDIYRDAYNEHFENIIQETKKGIETTRYITLSTERYNYEDAKNFFNTSEVTIQNCMNEIGSSLYKLNGNDRLALIQEFYNGEEEEKPDIRDYIKNFDDFTSDIAASYIEEYSNNFSFNKKKYGRALYVSKWGNELPDRFLKYLTDISCESVISIDYEPIPKEVAVKFLENKLMAIENRISKQQQRRNKNKDFATDISYKTTREKNDVIKIMDDMRDNDINAMFVSCTIIVLGNSDKELEQNVKSFKTICKQNGLKVEECYMKQREAISTALPLGKKYIESGRFMLASSAASLVPFTSEELEDYSKGSIMYGYNTISKKMIHGNRKKLMNGNSIVLGKPGAGKSVCLKDELSQVMLNSNDEIIVVDPGGDFEEIVKKYRGEYIDFSSKTSNHINPLHINIEDLDLVDCNEIIVQKCELMLALAEKAHKKELPAMLISIVDEITRNLYNDLLKGHRTEIPRLIDFKNELEKRNESVAKELALEMNIFVSGSLNLFNFETNINMSNRLVCFGIRDLGDRLFSMAMVVTMEYIKERVKKNQEKGIATWVYLDEYHVLLGNEYTENYLYRFIKEVRKMLGITGLATQNVKDFIRAYKPATMLENCECIVLLKQGPSDAKDIIDLFDEKLNESDRKFLTSCEPGQGIMIWGDRVVRFNRQISKRNILYNLFNTNGHEIADMKKGDM